MGWNKVKQKKTELFCFSPAPVNQAEHVELEKTTQYFTELLFGTFPFYQDKFFGNMIMGIQEGLAEPTVGLEAMSKHVIIYSVLKGCY